MTYEENKQEWLNGFSVEKQENNLFLVKNNNSGTYTIATNFDINTASYSGQIFFTSTKKELALKIFAETLMLTQSKVGVLI